MPAPPFIPLSGSFEFEPPRSAIPPSEFPFPQKFSLSPSRATLHPSHFSHAYTSPLTSGTDAKIAVYWFRLSAV